jgi:HK97 family phage major capsid protein
VPTDFRTEILAQVMDEEHLLSRTDQLQTSSNQLTVPTDATTPWGANGIQGYWLGEGDLKPQSKVALGETSIKLNKLAALVPVTDELLEDAPGLDSYLRKKVPEVFNYKIDLAIISGTGVGQPLGILNSAGTVSVAKETSQVADTVVFQNIVKMWSRMRPGSRSNAIWLTNQGVETQLFQMSMAMKNVAGTENVGGVPVYMPAGGISGSPFSTLFGRPIIASEAMNTLGDKGDIILADMRQYLTIVKSPGLRTDVSIHLWFDYDTTAYRFVMRIAGQPWWTTVVTSRDTVTRSPFVTLDERAG